MIVENTDRKTVVGEAIEVAITSAQKVKGLLGRDCLAAGEGLLFKSCSSLHTFFMHFPIDIVYMDRNGRVLKSSSDVRPFKLVRAPLRAYYALELPTGAIIRSATRVGDHLRFKDEYVEQDEPSSGSDDAAEAALTASADIDAAG